MSDPIRLRRWDIVPTGVQITTTREPTAADQEALTHAVGGFIHMLAGTIPPAVELAEIARKIGAFRILCEEASETDTGAAWELLDEIEDALKGLL